MDISRGVRGGITVFGSYQLHLTHGGSSTHLCSFNDELTIVVPARYEAINGIQFLRIVELIK